MKPGDMFAHNSPGQADMPVFSRVLSSARGKTLDKVTHYVRSGEIVMVVHASPTPQGSNALLGILTPAGYGLAWLRSMMRYLSPVRVAK